MGAAVSEALKYCHIDMNSFYASVEMLYDSHYRYVPYAVTGDPSLRHGIVLAKNDIAKKLGVKTGHTLHDVLRRIPNLEYSVARHKVYERFSESFRKILLTRSPWVQSFGPDEASVWVDEDITFLAKELCRQVEMELGITVSVGVSFNRAFAKLGSDAADRNSVMVISRENYRQVAWPMPAMDMLGVGRKSALALARLGVYTIGDLANTPVDALYSTFGKNGVVMHMFANGQDPTAIDPYDISPARKSYSHSSTTPYDLRSYEEAAITFGIMGTDLGRQLREANVVGKTVGIGV